MRNEPRNNHIGRDDFKNFITGNDGYIDKSCFVKNIINLPSDLALIIRPRRWGKSLNFDMLKTFLSIEVDQHGNPVKKNSNRILFEGGDLVFEDGSIEHFNRLKIADVDGGKYMRYQGAYPVISFPLKDIGDHDLETMKNQLKILIREAFRAHHYLEHSNRLDSYQKEILANYLHEKQLTDEQAVKSLKFLSEVLHAHYGKKPYILIDEYDQPINSIIFKNLLKPDKLELQGMVTFLKDLFSSCIKDNPHFEKIIFAGIFDTLKKEVGTGMNNVEVYDMFHDEFQEDFGFLQHEVDELAVKFGLKSEIKDKIQQWYNGYSLNYESMNGSKIYNPWSVVKYISDVLKNPVMVPTPKSYWVNSGSRVMLKEMLRLGFTEELVKKTENLILGKEQDLEFSRGTSLIQQYEKKEEQSYDINKEQLFTYLLFHAGYLTAVSCGKFSCSFTAPNYEVREEFELIIHDEARAIKRGDLPIATLNEFGVKPEDFKERVGKIEAFFHYDYEAKLVKAVIKQDLDEVNTIISSHQLRCDSSKMNFNLLQLGAISGNGSIFKRLLDYCGRDLLSKKKSITTLSAKDCAYLTKKSEILDQVGSYELALRKPSLIEAVICFSIDNFAITATTFTTAVTVFMKHCAKEWSKTLGLGTVQSLALNTGIGVAAISVKELVKNHSRDMCNNYDQYNEIATDLKLNGTLLQFAKYMLNHQNAHVVLSDCHEGGRSASHASYPLFQDTSIPLENHLFINFTLCAYSELS